MFAVPRLQSRMDMFIISQAYEKALHDLKKWTFTHSQNSSVNVLKIFNWMSVQHMKTFLQRTNTLNCQRPDLARAAFDKWLFVAKRKQTYVKPDSFYKCLTEEETGNKSFVSYTLFIKLAGVATKLIYCHFSFYSKLYDLLLLVFNPGTIQCMEHCIKLILYYCRHILLSVWLFFFKGKYFSNYLAAMEPK